MTTTTLVGAAIRSRIEPATSNGLMAADEFELPAATSLRIPRSHPDEQAIRSQPWDRRCVWKRAPGGQLRSVW